jgi:hypothetical protein
MCFNSSGSSCCSRSCPADWVPLDSMQPPGHTGRLHIHTQLGGATKVSSLRGLDGCARGDE